jgi:hypothetical protein
MLDPIVARPGVEHDAAEGQLVQLEARLIAELDGGVVVERMVGNLLADARQAYAGARVHSYLAILIERNVRRGLDQAHARRAAVVDFPVLG